MGKSKLEVLFIGMLNRVMKHRPAICYEVEYRLAAHYVGFGPGIKQRMKDAQLRDFRYDFAFIDQKVLVEIHGGEFSGGRHTSGIGFNNDRTKMNQALRLGWKTLEFTGTMLKKDPEGCMRDLIAVLGI